VRIRADEHVSSVVVTTVKTSALGAGFDLDSITLVGQRGSSDEHWITSFGKDGGTAILTADTDFVKRPHQVMAVHDAGLRIVHLPPKWANAPLHLQIAHLLIWWGRIEAAIRSASPRECWRPEWNISERGELQRVTVNYEEARKKLKKANRPSRQEVR
jgi:hypothetical protein